MDFKHILGELVNVSISLSSGKDTTLLLEKILLVAKHLSNADGGTIYSVTEDNQLQFDTLVNDTLQLYMGGSSGKPITFDPIPVKVNGEINTSALVAYAAGSDLVINIEDAYNTKEYDLSGPKKMDAQTGYRTQSVLTIPMKNHEGDLNGVLQLVNARQGNNVIPFNQEIEQAIRALASLAAVALTNRQLIDDMEKLFQSFTQLIAKAIDEKSPYTGGHCRRVPELTMMIAEAVHRHDQGPLASFTMTDEDKHELSLAGWLHDCGKIATPEHVMDKSTKLEKVFDRIELITTRFELAMSQLTLEYTRKIQNSHDTQEQQQLQDRLNEEISTLQSAREFVETANIGGEFMSEDKQRYIEDIANLHQVTIKGEKHPLLTPDEVYNLQVAKGTLTPEEREIINRHMDITIEMLESLPFPKHLKRVPEFAGGHHEKMDGTGYPKGLTKEQMSVPARMMAIADIFEALTASDRPYKPGKKISECLRIMGFMCKDKHIDADLFKIFVDEGVFLEYAQRYLSQDQIDDVQIEKIPGYLNIH
ncbi:HD domain-containing phosphohydrolase [Alteromonas sp. a30]|uniref:HD domain-containing phosphohydrolase n=1 Tax=Alteromonas sp. a30 TaxID=2730917 RepID=UPI002280E026|nr:HD domain-containing phosphohydrolase [Alteromonas sp. a30]MCY7295459.1 HD domain-containing protein [Alteromonas sp. a30]